MGCNCKKTFDKMEKYSDDYNPEKRNIKENIFIKILTYILQIGFGILIGCVSIAILPVLMLWFIGCLIIGKRPSIRLKNNKMNNTLKK